MARNIVPRVSGEETLGTPGKEFRAVYTQRIAGGAWEQIKELLAKYLPISGGAITGVILVGNCPGMAKATKDRELYLYGGTTNQDGAAIGLRGINFTGYGEQLRGSFGIAAVHPSGTVHTLNGLGDGRLLWDDINIGAGGVVSQMLGENGYVKFANGLIIQYGHQANGELTFPIAFTSRFSVTASSDYRGNNNVTCCLYDRDTGQLATSTTIAVDLRRVYIQQYGGNQGDFVFWQAIGF